MAREHYNLTGQGATYERHRMALSVHCMTQLI